MFHVLMFDWSLGKCMQLQTVNADQVVLHLFETVARDLLPDKL